MTENDFFKQQQAAMERMREMNRRSQMKEEPPHTMPPVPPFVKINEKDNFSKSENTLVDFLPKPSKKATERGFGIDFLDNLLKDGDSALILGLLLILMSDNCDKILLFALIYILL